MRKQKFNYSEVTYKINFRANPEAAAKCTKKTFEKNPVGKDSLSLAFKLQLINDAFCKDA